VEGEVSASSPRGVTTAWTSGGSVRLGDVEERESVLGDVGGRKGAGAPG
jgi:hypothetical protein